MYAFPAGDLGVVPSIGRTASHRTIDQLGLWARSPLRETMPYMTSPQPQPKLTQVVATALTKQTAHDRQRELVRASLLCR